MSSFNKIAKGSNFAKKLNSARFAINNLPRVNSLMLDKLKDPSYMMKTLSTKRK